MQNQFDELYSIFLNHRIISTDSRSISKGCLFFALKGDNFDGNKYANEAIEAGAAYAIIDDKQFGGIRTLLVNNVLETLQQLANFHRKKFNIPILAITGSNGKTTTKELTNAVLCQHYTVTSTKGNLNNHIGVPLTLLDISDKTQIAIIEMGANHQGEIAELCKIAEPTHGLITNIGKAHLGGFGGYEGVKKAKNELYVWLRNTGSIVFVNAANTLLMELSQGINRKLYGSEGENIFSKGRALSESEQLIIEWFADNGITVIETNLVGTYNFENVMAAICAGMFFKVPAEKIKVAISNYFPSNSRSQLMKTARNTIILDSYNANPTSMQVAIENFKRVKAIHRMVILGDMLELGDESLTEHSAIVKLVEGSGFEKAIFVGPDFKQVAAHTNNCFNTVAEARDWLTAADIQDYTILIKGSRGIRMENVLEAL
jgi:UDP-N-acetylmuramoyl-tripeptide--D-alanyl-D-alanine ligase